MSCNFNNRDRLLTRLQVYSRATGKLVLDLSSSFPFDKQDSSIFKGVKFVEKDKTVNEVTYDKETGKVTVNIYKIGDNSIKKTAYKLHGIVYYPQGGDDIYIVSEDSVKHRITLYKVEGSKVEKAVMDPLPNKVMSRINTDRWGYDDEAVILNYYNPEKKQLEYFYKYGSKFYATKDFPFYIINPAVNRVVAYKNYILTASTIDSQQFTTRKVQITVHEGNKELLSFQEKEDDYEVAVIGRKSKYLYVAIINSDKMKIYKYRQEGTGNSKKFKLDNKIDIPVKRNAHRVSEAIRKMIYDESLGTAILAENMYNNYTDFYSNINIGGSYTYMVEPELIRGIPQKGKGNSLKAGTAVVVKVKMKDRMYHMHIYNDHAFVINDTLFMIDKNSNLLYSNHFHVCCDKAVFQLPIFTTMYSHEIRGIFLFDFKSRKMQRVDYGLKLDTVDTLLLPAGKSRVAYIKLNSMLAAPPPDERAVFFKIDLSRKKPAPEPLFSVKESHRLAYSTEDNVRVYSHNNCMLFMSAHPSIDKYSLEFMVHKNKIYDINDVISCKSLIDVKDLVEDSKNIVKHKEEAVER
jgi:hypothetical protein